MCFFNSAAAKKRSLVILLSAVPGSGPDLRVRMPLRPTAIGVSISPDLLQMDLMIPAKASAGLVPEGDRVPIGRERGGGGDEGSRNSISRRMTVVATAAIFRFPLYCDWDPELEQVAASAANNVASCGTRVVRRFQG